MSVVFREVLSLGLSQIYLSQSKLAAVSAWFTPDNLNNFSPLPVRDFGDGRLTLTDGHTRAYAAYSAGLREVPTVYDDDKIFRERETILEYKECIKWCKRLKLYSIADLSTRILNDAEYVRLWDRRCDRMHKRVRADT